MCDVCACACVSMCTCSTFYNLLIFHDTSLWYNYAYHSIQSHDSRAKSSCCSRLLRQLHLFPWSCVLLCVLCCYATAKKAKVLWMLPRAPDCGWWDQPLQVQRLVERFLSPRGGQSSYRPTARTFLTDFLWLYDHLCKPCLALIFADICKIIKISLPMAGKEWGGLRPQPTLDDSPLLSMLKVTNHMHHPTQPKKDFRDFQRIRPKHQVLFRGIFLSPYSQFCWTCGRNSQLVRKWWFTWFQRFGRLWGQALLSRLARQDFNDHRTLVLQLIFKVLANGRQVLQMVSFISFESAKPVFVRYQVVY